MQELFKRICPICGKEFYSYDSEQWAYRIGDSKHTARGKYIRVCSWTCMRKWEREHDKQRKKKSAE